MLLLTILIICECVVPYILKEKWSALPVMTLQLRGAISKSSSSSASYIYTSNTHT